MNSPSWTNLNEADDNEDNYTISIDEFGKVHLKSRRAPEPTVSIDQFGVPHLKNLPGAPNVPTLADLVNNLGMKAGVYRHQRRRL